MELLLVTSHFYPEGFKANDMAFELARRGHDVTVLAPIPDYPQGKFYDGYGLFKRRKETVNGVKVLRTTIIPRHDGSAKWLALNYLTHTLFSCTRAFWLGLTKKYDAVIVHETSPVMVAIPGVIVKKMQKIPMHFWVLDLWPESLSAAGGINNKRIIGFFGKLTKWLYKHSDSILISSKGFRKSINAMGDFNDKITFYPNWVDETLTKQSKSELPEMPDGFNVVFAGNIGDAQDMPHIVEAARQLEGKGINFVLVGDGRKKEWVEKYVSENKLTNVFLPGRFPLESMPGLFAKADILFLALKKSPIFALTVPAKLQAYMSAGKLILAMIDGEGADVIKDADCGWSVNAEDSDALAQILLKIKQMPAEELVRKGLNGKTYSDKFYNFSNCIDNLENILHKSKK